MEYRDNMFRSRLRFLCMTWKTTLGRRRIAVQNILKSSSGYKMPLMLTVPNLAMERLWVPVFVLPGELKTCDNFSRYSAF